MRRLWRSFVDAFWTAFYLEAKKRVPDEVIRIHVEIDDAQAQMVLESLEARLTAFQERSMVVQSWGRPQ